MTVCRSKPVTPQGRPGFAWVDGNWERERAPTPPKIIVDPAPDSVGPVVRDHRATSQSIIRDHRTSTAPIVRDHRTTAVPVVRDDRKPGSVFDAAKNQGLDASAPWNGISTAGPVVRDHRTTSQPIIRDRRTTTGPIVRGHRSGSQS